MKFLEKYRSTTTFFIFAALTMLTVEDDLTMIQVLIALGFINLIFAVEKNGSGRGGIS
jgi:hypothetical protein